MRAGKILTLVLCGFAALAVLSCQGAESKNLESGQGEGEIDTRLASASNRFGLDLFKQLQLKDQGKNIFFSPLSITLALAMTYNGAAGETEKVMARTLKLDEMTLDEINQATAGLMKHIKNPEQKTELTIANSLWAKQGVPFKEDFLTRNRQFFGAEVASLNFSDPQALQTINDWVNRNTEGKISKIIDNISLQDVMFLINAIYFNGVWQKPFDKNLTKDAPFYLLSGGQKQFPMMSQSSAYYHYQGDKFQAVNIPYGYGRTSLYLFLPAKDSSLGDFLKGLSQRNWEHWMKSFCRKPGDIKIPRFKMDYDRMLNEPLAALGMGVAFSGGADFSKMLSGGGLFISYVRHKAVVEVNEEGTKAAAATVVAMAESRMICPGPPHFTFTADRPFLMAIRDNPSGAILFMGVVGEPQ